MSQKGVGSARVVERKGRAGRIRQSQPRSSGLYGGDLHLHESVLGYRLVQRCPFGSTSFGGEAMYGLIRLRWKEPEDVATISGGVDAFAMSVANQGIERGGSRSGERITHENSQPLSPLRSNSASIASRWALVTLTGRSASGLSIVGGSSVGISVVPYA